MSGWSGWAKTALACAVIWALGLMWMWLDYQLSSHVWTITPGPVLMMLAMALAAPVFVVCCIVLLVRRVRDT